MTKQFYLLFLPLFIFSCATERPVGRTEAEVLLKESKELIDDGRYLMAQERLNEIRSKHPYSFYATEAELLAANILFKQESYVESASAYTLFRDFHPKNKNKAFVLYKIAESYFMQVPTFDRDLSSALQAVKYYRVLLELFPNSEYAKDAQLKIDKCEDKLRTKEKYIADFYFKTELFDAAKFRYLLLLKKYHRPKEYVDYAKMRVINSAFYEGKVDECKKYYKDYKSTVSSESVGFMDKVVKDCK